MKSFSQNFVTKEKLREFYKAWEKTGLTYGQEPFPVDAQPYFLTKEQTAFFRTIVEHLQALVEKISDLFIKGQFRDVFNFNKNLLDLISADPGYSLFCPIGRWDSFYDGQTLKFLELNTDGTSGMVYVEELSRLYKRIFNPSNVFIPELKASVLQTLLKCYNQFPKKRVEKPQIAIVDWENVATRSEQEALRVYFNQMGYKTVLADPRALSYDGTSLSQNGFRIDLVYRRVVTGEYLAVWDEVGAMTKAYLDQNVCVIGSFRSQIGFDKRIFVILSSSEFDAYFTRAQNELRALCIPWTRLLNEGETIFQGQSIRIPSFLIDHPDQFVLKPPDLNRGQGVLLGSQLKKTEWKRKIQEHLGKGYLIQERVSVPQWGERGFHLGHFVFGGSLSGWMCRVGQDPLLHDHSDERLTPVLRV